MLEITPHISIPTGEITFNAIRAQGSGGQHVNKVSTAIHLRFDIHASSLPEHFKQKLLNYGDQRISGEGIIVIKVQQSRSQEKNRLQALQRLKELILDATTTQKQRRPTRPTRGATKRRLAGKKKRSEVKAGRKKAGPDSY